MLIICFFNKNKVYDFISEKMEEHVNTETTVTAKEFINTNYNYSNNDLNYEFTLLEFGSTGCKICKQMEGELNKIRRSKSKNINVVFLNTTYHENQILVTYYGIAAIPMQVLLDKNGNEIFKHYGFISAEDLIAKTVEKSAKQL